MTDLWKTLAEVLAYVCNAFVILVAMWCLFINFVADESHHPLDYYSNKMRTKPYWVIIVSFVLFGLMGAVYGANSTKSLNETLPEVAISCYLEGLIIGSVALFGESAATAVVACILYFFVAGCITTMVLIPTLDFTRAGAYYAGMFLVANMIFVGWAQLAVRRHLTLDGGKKLVPAGSERLFQAWSRAVFRWNPLVVCVQSLIYTVHHLNDVKKYGMACAIGYYVIATLLVCGCCKSFTDGTELE
jgi:MFS family permease